MSVEDRGDRSPHQSHGLGPAVLPKDLRLIRQKSQTMRRGSSPTATPSVPCNGLWSTPMPPNWNEVLRRAPGLTVHPLSCIPWEISRCFPNPKQVCSGPEFDCSLVHLSNYGGADENNLDMALEHSDLGSKCSGSSLPALAYLSTEGPETASTGPTACPPTSHTDVVHVYFIASGPFDGGLGSGHPLYCLLREVSLSHTTSLVIPACFTCYEHQY